MLAKHGYLPKILLKLQDKLPLCVACQFGCPSTPMALRGRKVALFKNWIKQNLVMEYQLITFYQLNTRPNTSNGRFFDKQTNMGMHHIC
jgi:hypothetical protein